MKKSEKISLLIYKKLDNTITKKEEQKLNKFLSKNKELKDEYLLIENIKKELNNSKSSELPKDFKIKLRQKLVDYNLNHIETKKRTSLFPVYITATSVLAVFLIVFAIGSNNQPTMILENNNGKINTENQTKKSELITKESDNNNKELSNENIKMATPKNETINEAKTSDIIHDESITLYNNEDTVNSDYSQNSRAGGSGGGSSGGAEKPSVIKDKILEIYVDCDKSLFESINSVETDEKTLKISSDLYEDVIRVLENIPYTTNDCDLKNENYFYIKFTN